MSDQIIKGRHVMFVTHVLPYPPAAGNEIRVLRMLRWFASKGCRISLVIKPMGVPEVSNASIAYLSELVDDLFLFDSRVLAASPESIRRPSDEAGIDPRLAEIQEMFCPEWFSSEVGKLIDEILPDVVFSEYALMGRVFVSSEYVGFLKVIDSIELFSRLKENLARQGVSDAGGLDLSAEQELFLLRRADIVLAIQQTEFDALTEMLPDREVLVTAMDLDLPVLQREAGVAGRVLMVGSDNQFNVRGARHFLEHIWPRVCAEMPGSSLHVVGKLSRCLDTSDPSVSLLGYVDSIDAEYQAACAVVNPCLHGTGLKIKTIEALAWGKAHVGWPVSADGIVELGNLPYPIARDDTGFVSALVSFLGDAALREQHESAARAFAQAHFSPDAVYGPLAARIEAILATADRSSSGALRAVSARLPPESGSGLPPVYVVLAGSDNDGGALRGAVAWAQHDWSPVAEGLGGINRLLHPAQEDAGALVLFVPAGIACSPEQLVLLARALAEDPLFAFAMPRLAEVGALERARRLAAHLPASERRLVKGAPLLVRAAVFRDFGLLDEQAVDLDSALVQLYVRANRRGFSARQVNAVVLESSAVGSVRDLQLQRSSDYGKAQAAQAALPEVRFERLLQHRMADAPLRDVLIDIRNLAPGFNGTAHHVLALLEQFAAQAPEHRMRLHFWVLPESAEFHGLHVRYGEAVIHQLAPDQCFDASIRLTQPWSLTEVRDQANVAAVNVFSVLDTIAWDCHYIRMPHLEGVWRAMAEYADGIVYISDYSRCRFNTRFPASLAAVNVVAHCSMDPAEYWAKEEVVASADADSPYVLVVGNRYYHKGLAEVVPALSAAFPNVHFKVLGECNRQFLNVEQIASGGQTTDSMARLFGHCSCLVFPSFYEGFGLPIFEALAFGKPVLARHSELIEELCAHLEPVREVIPFATTTELLRALKALLPDQAALSERRVPRALPDRPYRWKDSATDILNLLDDLMAREDFARCRSRLEFFYRLEMFDLERAGWSDATQNMVSFEVEKEE